MVSGIQPWLGWRGAGPFAEPWRCCAHGDGTLVDLVWSGLGRGLWAREVGGQPPSLIPQGAPGEYPILPTRKPTAPDCARYEFQGKKSKDNISSFPGVVLVLLGSQK